MSTSSASFRFVPFPTNECYDAVVQHGYNHNLRHGGVLFHVQSEDCGLDNPQVVTHVFVGGNVLASRRSTYEKFRAKAAVKEIVIAIMQEQHKEMMKDLVHGRIPSVQEFLGTQETPVLEEQASVEQAPQVEVVTEPEAVSSPPVGKREVVPPPKVAERPYRKPGAVPTTPARTLDTTGVAEKTLDELILDFLSTEKDEKS